VRELQGIGAVVLASGAGTRLGNATRAVPKPMLTFNGRPFLYYLLHWLIRSSVRPIVVTTWTHADIIDDFIRSESGFPGLVSTVREDTLVSTAAGAQVGLEAVGTPMSLLMPADSVLDLDVRGLVRQHREMNAQVTAVVTQREDFPYRAMVKLQRDRRIAQFWPTIPTALSRQPDLEEANTTGFFLANTLDLLAAIRPHDTGIEREPMSRLIPHAFGYLYEQFFLDFGLPENYRWLKTHPEAITKYLGEPSCSACGG